MTKIIGFAATLVLFLSVTVSAQSANEQVNLMTTTLPQGRDPQRYKGYVEPQFKIVV